MDYCDMAECLRKELALEQEKRSQPGYYDGCTKLDHEVDELLVVMEANSVVETTSSYTEAVPLRTHHHPDFAGLEDKLKDPQMVGRTHRPGVRPQIAELADWCKTVSQGGTGRIVSLAQ